MRLILALALAGGLSLGMATTSHAQVAVGVNSFGGVGLPVGNPYGIYSSGYYGLGGVGVVPGTTIYSSGYGVAPLGGVGTLGYPAPVVSAPFVATGYYPYPAYGSAWSVRRGLFGRPRIRGYYW